MREWDVHRLLAPATLDDGAVVVELVRAELDLHRHGRDGDDGDADERLGSAGERLEVDRRGQATVEPDRAAACVDRRRVVSPGPAHGESLEALDSTTVAATLMRGKPLAERIRSEVAAEVRAIGRIGLVTVLVGDDPASEMYIRLKHKAAVEAGFETNDLRLPADAARGNAPRDARRAERVRRGRRDPRPAAAARPPRRGAHDPCRRARRRTSTASTR